MAISVKKRDGEVVAFETDKIRIAVEKAISETNEEVGEDTAAKVAKKTHNKIKKDHIEGTVSVDYVHRMVEESIMDMKLYEVAREYITYRDRHKPDIFRPRIAYKPFEYPQMQEFTAAIEQSYWVVGEFNYISDIQDFKVNTSEKERSVIKNTMLAISQIEAYSVKSFWSKVYDRMPKPEIADVGACFADSERRHSEAYSHLLQILSLNDEFKTVTDIPAIKNRIQYLKKFVSPSDSSNKEYMQAILLFSMFIENVSLFGQFLIMMAFDNYQNRFTGIGNAVQATSKEEVVHSLFGAELISILRTEHPEWFDEELDETVRQSCLVSYESEKEVLSWIFENGDLDFITKYEVDEFLKDRYNRSMQDIGMPRVFENVDQNVIAKFAWFDLQINATSHADFFARRSVNYSKNTQAFTADSIF